jgi:hypothetical protein
MTIDATVSPQSLTQSTPDATEEQAASSGFAMTYALTFLTLFLTVMVINLRGNGAGLFPCKTNPSVSERPWKTRRLEEHFKHKNAPKMLVMGSSRMMQVQPPYLAAITGKPVFNYAVSAAGPLDWLAQLRYTIKLGVKPELIVVGVDEFAFGGVFNRYEMQLAGHWGLFKCVPFPENVGISKNLAGMMNLQSTWDSLFVLLNPPTLRVRNAKRVDHLILDDGYLIYRAKVSSKAAGEYDLQKQIHDQAIRWRLQLDQTTSGQDPIDVLRPTERKTQLFTEFLDLARANYIEVRVVFLPLHPDYEMTALTPPMREIRAELGRDLQALCANHGCVYRDFTSLASYQGSPNEFWDGAHQTPENLRRMINVLFDLPPEKIVAKVPTDDEILRHPPAITTLNTW